MWQVRRRQEGWEAMAMRKAKAWGEGRTPGRTGGTEEGKRGTGWNSLDTHHVLVSGRTGVRWEGGGGL